MLSLFCFYLLLSVLAYEKIDIYSDNLSLLNITRDNVNDRLTVSSETRIAVSYKSTVFSHFSLPEGFKEFQFSITNPEFNYGRYILETPFNGVHIAITYDRQRPLGDLCDILSKTLPCFNVKECNMQSICYFLLFTVSRSSCCNYWFVWCVLDSCFDYPIFGYKANSNSYFSNSLFLIV